MQDAIGTLRLVRDALSHRLSKTDEIFDDDGQITNYYQIKALEHSIESLDSAIRFLEPLGGTSQ